MADTLDLLLEHVRPRGTSVERHTVGELPTEWDLSSPLTVAVVISGAGDLVSGRGTRASFAGGSVVISTQPTSLALTASAAGGGEAIQVVVGRYLREGSVCARLLEGVPDTVVVPGEPSARSIVDLLAAEVADGRPGRQSMVDRYVDLLLVAGLPAWFETQATEHPPWMRAQSDPVIGPAVQAIHDRPDVAWTVASLSQLAGVSRSGFARRFAALMGEPPASYLACWRLCLAADLLRLGEATVGSVARQVGYANAYSFSAAFTRRYGVRPSEHRRISRPAASDATPAASTPALT